MIICLYQKKVVPLCANWGDCKQAIQLTQL